MPQIEKESDIISEGIIQIKKIDKVTQESIARSFLPLIEDYFKDPAVQRKYKLWLEKRKKIFV